MFNFFNKKSSDKKETLLESELNQIKSENQLINQIQEFEEKWFKRVEESEYILVPSQLNRKNGVVEDLIDDRGIRSTESDSNGLFPIDNYQEENMIMIENSLIKRFIMENNGLFLMYSDKSKILSNDEFSIIFTHFQEKIELRNRTEKINLSNGFDFISVDKKIISIHKNIYYLDWREKIYYGFNDVIETKWEQFGGRSEIFNKEFITSNLFRLPLEINSTIVETWYENEVLVWSDSNSELLLFPEIWMRDKTFKTCINHLFSFNFREKLIQRTLEFYKIHIHETNKLKNLKKNQIQLKLKERIKSYDSNNNNIIDVTEENGYGELLESLKVELKDKDQTTIQNLIKLKLFLVEKSDNLNRIFQLYTNVENEKDMSFYLGVLNNEINIYQKLSFHSMSLLTFLTEDDMFSFYEIYEVFDELNVFNSKWEKELSRKLDRIKEEISNTNNILNEGFKKLSDDMYNNTLSINKSLDKLTYITKESIKNLTSRMDKRLESINSSVQTNNLLTLINTYQTYKINKNTKGY